MLMRDLRWMWHDFLRDRLRQKTSTNVVVGRLEVHIQPGSSGAYHAEARYFLKAQKEDGKILGLDLGPAPYQIPEFSSDVHDTAILRGDVFAIHLREGRGWANGLIATPFEWHPGCDGPFLRAPSEFPQLVSRLSPPDMHAAPLPAVLIVLDELIKDLCVTGIASEPAGAAWHQAIVFRDDWLIDFGHGWKASAGFRRQVSSKAEAEVLSSLESVRSFVEHHLGPVACSIVPLVTTEEVPSSYHGRPGIPIILHPANCGVPHFWPMDLQINVMAGLVSCAWGTACRLVGNHARELEHAIAISFALWWANTFFPTARGRYYLRYYRERARRYHPRNMRARLIGADQPWVTAHFALQLYQRMSADAGVIRHLAALQKAFSGRYLAADFVREELGLSDPGVPSRK